MGDIYWGRITSYATPGSTIRKMATSIWGLCLVCCCLLTFVDFSTCDGAAFEQAIDSFMNAAIQCKQNKNPGLTVSVVKDGQVVMAKGYGIADLSDGRKVTNRTLFGVASISKSFAAALMVKLLHEKHMSIYTKPGDILPEGFQYEDPEFTQYATVRDLMTHCLGVPGNQGMRLDTTLTKKDAARRIRYFKPIYKFRLHYLYSNLHYGIISYLAQVLGGKTYEDLIQEHFYTPLGMTDSDFLRTANRSAKDVAQGYADDEVNGGIIPVPEELNKLWGVYGGSTGIMSSSADMTKWMMMHLSGGLNAQGHVVMNSADVHTLHSPQTAIRSSTVQKYFHRPQAPFTITETSYAFGWRNGFYKGYPILRHTGTTYGYSSLVTLFPDSNLGIFTSMTGEDENYIARTLLHSYLADLFLGETPTFNETTFCTYPEPWYPKKPVTHHALNKHRHASRPLTEYLGVYHHVAYGNLVIRMNSTVNQLQMTYGAGQWILYPESKSDSFAGEAFGITYKVWDLRHVQFHVHSSSPTTVEVPNFESHAPPVFQRTTTGGTGGSGTIIG